MTKHDVEKIPGANFLAPNFHHEMELHFVPWKNNKSCSLARRPHGNSPGRSLFRFFVKTNVSFPASFHFYPRSPISLGRHESLWLRSRKSSSTIRGPSSSYLEKTKTTRAIKNVASFAFSRWRRTTRGRLENRSQKLVQSKVYVFFFINLYLKNCFFFCNWNIFPMKKIRFRFFFFYFLNNYWSWLTIFLIELLLINRSLLISIDQNNKNTNIIIWPNVNEKFDQIAAVAIFIN